MKFERFLNWIKYQLINTPDINLNTVKRFMTKFIECLSDTEREKYSLHLQIIMTFTTKQITIDNFVLNNNIVELENKLDNIKNGKN